MATDIPLGRADYHRSVAKEARIQTRNRYYEANPVLTEGQAALIARPALRRWLPVGDGPIRGVYSQPGSFEDALFVVSDNSWFLVEKDETVNFLMAGVFPGQRIVSMAGTGTIGTVPEFMYMADGRNLWLYIANGYAKGTVNGTPAANDTIEIGGKYYRFVSGSVNAGAPAGTLANPWLVALGGTIAAAWQNFAWAVMDTGDPGTDYSTSVQPNTAATVIDVAATAVTVRANLVGPMGNGVSTTETGAALAWTGATMSGGGEPSITAVEMPDDVGAISVGYIASYIVVIPAQGAGINGRFFWIEPGETTIDPLNYATAERAPDPIFQVVVFGDQFWLPGSNTTEVWYFTGDIESPVLRLQGVTFDRGTWEGTALQVKESMIIVDSDGGVFQIAGGLKKISNPAIEERIREAIQYQAARP